MHRRPYIVLALSLALTALGAVSATGAAAAASPSKIHIHGFEFGPNTLTVHPGQWVHVVNLDARFHGIAHTIDSDDEVSFESPIIEDGDVHAFVAPTTPGTYPYHCDIHDFMTGTLVVEG